MFCEKCGQELNEHANFCMECGTPNPAFNTETTKNIPIQAASAPTNSPTQKAAKKPNKLLIITVILIPAIVVFLIFSIILASVIGVNLKNAMYESKMSDAYELITSAADLAESYSSLESKVWYNCIYEKESQETDEYTQNDYGNFYEDFNDALNNFYIGEIENYNLIKTTTEEINALMLELKDCPSKFEDDYKILKELYVAYADLADLAIGDSTYSYNTFSAALEKAKSEYKSAESDARIAIG